MAERPTAIFLDRDGTLIEDVGLVRDAGGLHLFPDTVEALKCLQQRHLLFVVTNQSGVADGAIRLEEVHEANRALDRILARQGVRIRDWYVCPHNNADRCACRKPNPGLLFQAADRHGVDLRRSFVVGDHPHDALTGKAQGVYGLYLLTGHGRKHLPELPADRLVFHSIAEAASWIEAHPNGERDLERRVGEGAEAIRRSGLTAFPTETVYGLGADALDPEAVARIFSAKGRPHSDPLIVHVSDEGQVQRLVDGVPEAARRLMRRFWPGPLTLVLPKSVRVPDLVTSGLPTVAVRMPAHPLALELIRRAQTPIAAPSANAFGRTSPTTARHVREQLEGRFDVLIDGGACRVGVESTVLSLLGAEPRVLRPGGLSREEIELEIGSVGVSGGEPAPRAESPGLLPGHYAPRTPLVVLPTIPEELAGEEDVGFLLLRAPSAALSGPVEVLSADSDLYEAARNLYVALRRLDSLGLRKIVTHPFPLGGIGAALDDRICRASRGSRPE